MKYKVPHLSRFECCSWFILLGCLAGSLPVQAQEKNEEQRRAEAVQRELNRLMEDERREQSKRDYQAVVTRSQRAVEMAEHLLASTQAFAKRLEDLLRNDEGKKLASDRPSLIAFVDILDHPVATQDEMRARHEAVASTLKLLKSQEEMVTEGHRPSDTVQDEVQQAYFWAIDTKIRVDAQQTRLDTLIAKAPSVADLTSAILLDEAVRNHRTRIPQMSAQAQVVGQEIAKDSARGFLVDAAVLAELQRAQAEAARLIVESKAQADRQKLDYETRIAELQKTIDTEHARLRVEQADRAAELDRKEKEAAANRFAKDVDAKVGRDSTISNADKKLLVQRCQDPQVKEVLAPFLAKGYYRPAGAGGTISLGSNYNSPRPVPISYRDFQEVGALSETGPGCDALYRIAREKHDNMRPRWPHVWDWRRDPRTSELVPKAQKLLIELGPTLVEQGMLQP